MPAFITIFMLFFCLCWKGIIVEKYISPGYHVLISDLTGLNGHTLLRRIELNTIASQACSFFDLFNQLMYDYDQSKMNFLKFEVF